MEGRITDVCEGHVCVRVCGAHVCECVFGRPCIHAATVRGLSIGEDRMWLGSQAFRAAFAFNANIGAWNTASVTAFSQACAASSSEERLICTNI